MSSRSCSLIWGSFCGTTTLVRTFACCSDLRDLGAGPAETTDDVSSPESSSLSKSDGRFGVCSGLNDSNSPTSILGTICLNFPYNSSKTNENFEILCNEIESIQIS
uniref:(northern house mosquito) hypothetical protein n=1 Tax=Culex pipiens TaxID=7175 RepID=A0A8D8A7P2_CULPI